MGIAGRIVALAIGLIDRVHDPTLLHGEQYVWSLDFLLVQLHSKEYS